MSKATISKFESVTAYLAAQPPRNRAILQKIRKTIKHSAPEVKERISYNIPGFECNGMLLWMAGFKNHVSVYPVTAAMERKLKKEIAPYRVSKGTLQFVLDDPVPYDLISEIARIRVEENAKRRRK